MSTSNNLRRKIDRAWLRKSLVVMLAGVGAGVLFTAALGQVGLMPVPTLQGVQVQAEASFDLSAQRYMYAYTVTNPATNTGQISNVMVDITTQIPPAPGSPIFDPSGLTIPVGPNRFPFDRERARVPLALPGGTTVLPFGQRVPGGWNGGLTVDGFATFHSRKTARIIPGQTRSGLVLISGGMPSIRRIQVHPFWMLTVEDSEAVTPEERRAAADIERSIIFHTFALGPSAQTPGTFGHWNQLRDDLNQAIQLGWIPDQTLATTLVSQLASARQALDAQKGTDAKTGLKTLIQTITQSTPAQRRREAFDLVLLNALRLI